MRGLEVTNPTCQPNRVEPLIFTVYEWFRFTSKFTCSSGGVLPPHFFENLPGRRPTIGTPPRMRTVDGVVHDVVTGSA